MRQAVAAIAAMWIVLPAAVSPAGPRMESVASARERRADPRVRNVLLLHSYDPTYEWTLEVTRGILSVLAVQPFETELRVEYMDAKRTRPEQRNELTRVLLEKKYRGIPIDLVVTTDDDATAFAMRADSGLPAEVPVVYCGVSSQETLQHAPRERFTGVEEVFRAQDFLLATLKLWPRARTVAVVTDNSPTGKDQQALYRELAKEETGRAVPFSWMERNWRSRSCWGGSRLPGIRWLC